MCGEQINKRVSGYTMKGSPPRVRGTVHDPKQIISGNGITPACAGNSDILCHIGAHAKDHPRVCGEQF